MTQQGPSERERGIYIPRAPGDTSETHEQRHRCDTVAEGQGDRKASLTWIKKKIELADS